MSNILILAEKRDQGLHPIVFELMGAARKITKDRDDNIKVAIIGHETLKLAEDLLSTGADEIFRIEHPLLEEYAGDAYVNGLKPFLDSVGPDVILMGQTHIGRDLAPRIAFRLNGAAAAMDCLDMDLDAVTGKLKVKRPVFGGSILADYQFGRDVTHQIVTVRSKAFEAIEPVPTPEGKITSMPVELDASRIRTKTLERTSLLKEGEARLEDADIIVSGGWGLSNKENYQLIEELAAAIGGLPGASRPICDLEWTDHSRHIGLTGKVVAPELYLAVGISGAMHHIAGCTGAKVIVGINIDPKASVFKYAKYGIVGDYAEVIPALIRQLNSAEN
jgi:caffeyl-CoA reductase-Etf complex subunit CarE